MDQLNFSGSKPTRKDYCEFIIATIANFTQTNMAEHNAEFSHDAINRFLMEDDVLPNSVWESISPPLHKLLFVVRFVRLLLHYYDPVRLLGHFSHLRFGFSPSVGQYPGSVLPGFTSEVSRVPRKRHPHMLRVFASGEPPQDLRFNALHRIAFPFLRHGQHSQP